MIAKFNPTGTHIHKGFLKVRIDLYPEPTDKTYAIHHVERVDVNSKQFKRGYKGEMDETGSPTDIDAYNTWRSSLPKVWKTNPCLCHFVKIDADTPLDDSLVKQVFDSTIVVELDDALSKGNTQRVSQIMKPKSGNGRSVKAVDIEGLNNRLLSPEVKV